LLIVESPTKTKSLSKYLGRDFEILASMGHVRDLPSSRMGVEVKKSGKKMTFEPSYEVMADKLDQMKKLAKAAKDAEVIYLASDPDREGEAIAWHVKEILTAPVAKKKKEVIKPSKAKTTKPKKKAGIADLGFGVDDKKFKRVTFQSITAEAVKLAIESPSEIDMDLVNAQQGRRFLDRLVGYKLSPILWKKVRRGLSAGRVQSVAVRLIVDKESEIAAFVPKEYWQIVVTLAKDGEKFVASYVKWQDKKHEVTSKTEADKVLSELNEGSYLVDNIRRYERRAQPHPPFRTSTLQQAAANVLGWSAKRTMSVAQKLYEQGDITYHRTDSLNLASVALDGVRRVINEKYGEKYLPEKPNFYKSGGKVLAQEAHEAVRPTHFEVTPDKYKGQDKMASDQQKLYSLIWRRTVASQMNPAVFDETKVEIARGKAGLLAEGQVIKFDGWRVLYNKDRGEDAILPELSEKDELKKTKLDSVQKFTMPPARYNDASLIKELEKRGIGRPSTYAAIISTIEERNYVEKKDKRFYPTTIGTAVTEFLVTNFPEEMDYSFTAKMEDELDNIAQGKLKWDKMLGDFWKGFESKLEKVDKDAARVGVPAEKTGEKCPLCEDGEVVIREGRFGKFYSCEKYPECKYTAQFVQYLEGATCEKCQSRVVVKKTRFGKEFFGCEKYPKCDWASWKKPKIGEEENNSDMDVTV
jgi:DNA topoisomerase I